MSGAADHRNRRAHLWVLASCAAVMVLHQATHWQWFIEDAAICFAYARNLVEGHGGVALPGGERVEAVSNPTWILWLMGFQALGLDGFVVAKPLAMGMGLGTLGLVWHLARRALPSHDGWGALLAPAFVALSSQHAIWSASGLENAWFTLLLAWLIARTVHEAEHGGAPIAALLALTLAWTRPEAVLYAAFAGLWYLVGCVRSGRGLAPVGRWLLLFWVPSLLLEALRLWYFAWPLPNTYYAKLGSRGSPMLDWDARGWLQLRDYADRLWQGYQAPLYVIGLTGLRGRPVAIGLGATALLALSLLWPGPVELQGWALWPELPTPPRWFTVGRILALGAAGLMLPFLALQGATTPTGRLREHTLVLCGHLLFATLLFSIAADGDWMGGYRWMSLGIAPAAVLIAVGLTHGLDALRDQVEPGPTWGRVTWIAATLAVGVWLPPNMSQIRDHLFHNYDETPRMIHRRVDYLRHVARLTFHEGPVVNLDIDMGAFMWWAPDFEMLDIGKLIDVPLARHWYQQRAFVEEYLHVEHPFTFSNLGFNTFWARSSGIPQYPWFHDEYFELPGYRTARGLRFIGIMARRDLVMARRGELTGPRRTRFDQQLVLEDLVVPAPWTPGQHAYVEVPWATNRVRPIGSQVKVFLFLSDDDHLVTWSLPLGYGLYPMDGWRPREVFRGRHTVPVPADLPPGRYDLGVYVLAPEGHVWQAIEGPDDAVLGPEVPPRAIAGEVRFVGAVEVLAAPSFDRVTEALWDTVLADAAAGRCEAAQRAWSAFGRHRPAQHAWLEERRGLLAPEAAACWARRAETADDDDDAADLLARAHAWDPQHPLLAEVGAPVAARLLEEGRAAGARQDWELAYRRYEQLLAFQPWRAWARRWAEEARDHRLGLVGGERIGLGGVHELPPPEDDAP